MEFIYIMPLHLYFTSTPSKSNPDAVHPNFPAAIANSPVAVGESRNISFFRPDYCAKPPRWPSGRSSPWPTPRDSLQWPISLGSWVTPFVTVFSVVVGSAPFAAAVALLSVGGPSSLPPLPLSRVPLPEPVVHGGFRSDARLKPRDAELTGTSNAEQFGWFLLHSAQLLYWMSCDFEIPLFCSNGDLHTFVVTCG